VLGLVQRALHLSVRVRCHHGSACPLVADGADGLWVWKVAANILNKQSRTADSGWPSSLVVGRGTKRPTRKTFGFFTKRTLVPRTRTDSLAWPKDWNIEMRFGTWNVRSLHRTGALKTAARQSGKYKLDLVGVKVVRRKKGGTE
jgi:hypothetical protein